MTDTIRALFLAAPQLDRPIEKVINFGAATEDDLAREADAYIVTPKLEAAFQHLLTRLDQGMQDGSPEVGVWISGFYGSGKSSFAKYFGMALDPERQVHGRPFLEYLADRIEDGPLRQQFKTVARRHEPVVVLIDLASDQMATGGGGVLSEVIAARTMQWAGYARDPKIAQLELLLEKDGRREAFETRFSELARGASWGDMRDKPLVQKSLAARLAAEFYPHLWPTPEAFNQVQLEDSRSVKDQLSDVLELIQRRTGRDKVLFVLDEVGQFLSGSSGRLHNLQGVAETFKNLARGKVWFLATAQQTLTADDPRFQYNTNELYKVKDRFPVTVDLEADDIRVICHRRLLGKSAEAQKVLGDLFDKHGPQLRFLTRLSGRAYERTGFEREAFINLYPFLPQHFDLLLGLLSRLARTTGGVGLRSAIRVIQDILVGRGSEHALAQASVGTLATAVTFYDTLRHDLVKSFPHVAQAVQTVAQDFGAESDEARVAKAIAILQVLDDLPATDGHLAAILHPAVDAPSEEETVTRVREALLAERQRYNLGEVGEGVRFLSPEVHRLDEERRALLVPGAERERLRTEILRELFTPLPSATLEGARRVNAGLGLRLRSGAPGPAFAGERETVQFVLEWTAPEELDAVRDARMRESLQPGAVRQLFWIAPHDERIERELDDLYRDRQTAQRHRGRTTDKEASDFIGALDQTVERRLRSLRTYFETSLRSGVIVFRNSSRAAGSLGTLPAESASAALADALPRIFDRYRLAPHQAESGLADAFLKADLRRISQKTDPLGVVKASGSIHSDHAALRALTDYLAEHEGLAEGSALLAAFSEAPYGWSKDTTRYLVAALLAGGRVTLRVGAQEVTHGGGEEARAAFKSNQSFGRIGVRLRDAVLSNDSLDRAARRLLKLTGKNPLPLEPDLCRAALDELPEFQTWATTLAALLSRYSLPGSERASSIVDRVRTALSADASGIPALLGQEQSDLYEDLMWLKEAHTRLPDDSAARFGDAQALLRALERLPESAADLRTRVEDSRQKLVDLLASERFFLSLADVQTAASSVRDAVQAYGEEQARARREEVTTTRARLEALPAWQQLSSEDRTRLAQRLDALAEIEAPASLDALDRFLGADEVTFVKGLRQVEHDVERMGKQRQDVVYPKAGGTDGLAFDGGGEDAVPSLSGSADVPDHVTPENLEHVLEQIRSLVRQHGALRLR